MYLSLQVALVHFSVVWSVLVHKDGLPQLFQLRGHNLRAPKRRERKKRKRERKLSIEKYRMNIIYIYVDYLILSISIDYLILSNTIYRLSNTIYIIEKIREENRREGWSLEPSSVGVGSPWEPRSMRSNPWWLSGMPEQRAGQTLGSGGRFRPSRSYP